MAIKINVGVSKKLGLPDYGSAGASCNLELEIDPHLLESDLAGFHDRVRSAYVAAQQAVQDQLQRLLGPKDVAPADDGKGVANGLRPADANGLAPAWGGNNRIDIDRLKADSGG